MNIFNRLVMIVLLLAIVLATVIFAAVPGQSSVAVATFFDWVKQSVDMYMTGSNWAMFAAGRVFIGGGIVIIALFLLWLELRRPRRKTVRVEKLEGGEAHITVDSIGQRLAYNIDQLPEVVKVTPHIISRGGGVDIDLLLETSPEVEVPMKTQEVLQVTREVVTERMGLKLGKVQVKIKHAPFPKE
jgi:hypothetical protein